ncbi:hypothetical protein PVAP13_2KG479010 [Panicum virgatum]|uniref:Uncharacterized protein n=1 Tax=Panicum virgatum TaxID=38727 RepID=A0A8T0WLA8_PANVG|nr:hypothetical protein PVAP13_2KG479010 [Panicum virgatum]
MGTSCSVVGASRHDTSLGEHYVTYRETSCRSC